MADVWVVTCRWPDGDINHRMPCGSKLAAENNARVINEAGHCSLPHVVEKLEANARG